MVIVLGCEDSTRSTRKYTDRLEFINNSNYSTVGITGLNSNTANITYYADTLGLHDAGFTLSVTNNGFTISYTGSFRMCNQNGYNYTYIIFK